MTIPRPAPRLRLKAKPEDFIVRESLRVEHDDHGLFTIYRVTRRMLTTPEVQEVIARKLGVPPRTLSFPALKDKGAQSTQYFSLKGRGPDQIMGEGWVAEFAGRVARSLGPGDLAGNWFTITLHNLSAGLAQALGDRLAELAAHGIPNYFDEQRFGSRGQDGVFMGKAILQGDAEGALRSYFVQTAPGDTAAIRAFKHTAQERWGDWASLFAVAPKSNHRSILNFLKDHPTEHRKALNLASPRLLPLLLQAYQSCLWNRIASRIISGNARPAREIAIAGEKLALPDTPPPALAHVSLPLPQHRAEYAAPWQSIIEGVLAEEGLTLNDLKARILKEAYLPKGSRPLVVVPRDATSEVLQEEDARMGLAVTFFLPPGSYATWVIKVLDATSRDLRTPNKEVLL